MRRSGRKYRDAHLDAALKNSSSVSNHSLPGAAARCHQAGRTPCGMAPQRGAQRCACAAGSPARRRRARPGAPSKPSPRTPHRRPRARTARHSRAVLTGSPCLHRCPTRRSPLPPSPAHTHSRMMPWFKKCHELGDVKWGRGSPGRRQQGASETGGGAETGDAAPGWQTRALRGRSWWCGSR